MGSPSIFVYDCSNAGLIVKSFKQFALQREQELEVRPSRPRTGADCPVSPRLGGGATPLSQSAWGAAVDLVTESVRGTRPEPRARFYISFYSVSFLI